jgi:cytochrome c-type biogenesis protein
MMLLLGAVIAALQLAVGQVLSVAAPLAYVLIILLGVLMMLGTNPFSRTPQLKVPVLDNALASAYVYGLVFGPVAFPCSGPLVVGIFLYSFGVADVLSQLVLLLVFGLGLGFPLVILSFLARVYQDRLTSILSHHYAWVNRVGGLLLVAVGVWGLRENWEYVVQYL